MEGIELHVEEGVEGVGLSVQEKVEGVALFVEEGLENWLSSSPFSFNLFTYVSSCTSRVFTSFLSPRIFCNYFM